mmetsp:Transcript_23612/g.34663  ORF Transcript_23612/g.34663 Transcript_23612/m.34663 type:complete len:292 (-) Transcript_23612:263-1138(-)
MHLFFEKFRHGFLSGFDGVTLFIRFVAKDDFFVHKGPGALVFHWLEFVSVARTTARRNPQLNIHVCHVLVKCFNASVRCLTTRARLRQMCRFSILENCFFRFHTALVFVAPDNKVEEIGQHFCRNVIFHAFLRPILMNDKNMEIVLFRTGHFEMHFFFLEILVQALILDISNAVNSNFASTLSQNDGFDHHVLNIFLLAEVVHHTSIAELIKDGIIALARGVVVVAMNDEDRETNVHVFIFPVHVALFARLVVYRLYARWLNLHRSVPKYVAPKHLQRLHHTLPRGLVVVI